MSKFRNADINAGGQGAPLSALYHQALFLSIPKPVIILNISGLNSLTWLGSNGEILAFDVGVGINAINDWVFKHASQQTDYNGALAALGVVNVEVLSALMTHQFLNIITSTAAIKTPFT